MDGFANWFEVQSKEEWDHVMLFRRYLLNQGAHISLKEISAANANYTKLDDGITATLAHEQMITASISEIYSTALDCKDYGTTQFLDWFIKEQGEEDENATDLYKKFELFGSDSKGLYLLDAELMTRAYTPPSLVL